MTYQPKSGILLSAMIGANMNTTGDQAITVSYARYVVRRIVVGNASISLTVAAGGVYTAAAKGGTAIVSAAQLYSFLTAASKFLDLTLAAILGTDVRTESILYLSLTTGQGAAATADIYIYGDVLA